MDDLPELAFDQILSYLSLEDRLKARDVSRIWRSRFDSYSVKSLCFSELPIDYIFQKNRLVVGEFAQNFVHSPRFDLFFTTFGQTILCNLKRLRLCDLRLEHIDEKAFAPALNSFNQLEQLDIIGFTHVFRYKIDSVELTLPMLRSIHLENFLIIEKLVLDAPKLKRIKLVNPVELHLVHNEPVESLLINRFSYIEVSELKNLQYLHHDGCIDSTLLSSLPHLKELHLDYENSALQAFKQKQQCGNVNLKIYLWGLLMNGPDDPRMESHFEYFTDENIAYMAKNPLIFADEIPLYKHLYYDVIERIPLELQANILSKFTDLREIVVDNPVQETQCFLDLLQSLHIVELKFTRCDQPLELYDRLPETVQKLHIGGTPSDFRFLLRLQHLIHLELRSLLDPDWIKRLFQELPFLLWLKSDFFTVRVTNQIGRQKQFEVRFGARAGENFPGLNTAFQFLVQVFNREKDRRCLV